MRNSNLLKDKESLVADGWRPDCERWVEPTTTHVVVPCPLNHALSTRVTLPPDRVPGGAGVTPLSSHY